MKIKRWQFLLFSTIFLLIALAVGTGKYFSVVRQDRLEEMRETQEINEQLLEQLREAREQLQEASDRLNELEDMLLNLRQTEQIVNGAMPSRSGRQFTATTMPLISPSGFSPARFERAFAGTGMAGLGESLCLAEAETGVNAIALAGIIVHETGWGSSRLAQEKNNLGGLGACGPGRGMAFDSRTASIDFLAQLLAIDYAAGGKFFGGSHDLRGIGKRYAEDPRWAQKVAGCMKIIVERGSI
jgi:beta-N-acetylglucosaminidase